MRVYNRYALVLTCFLLASTVVAAFYGVDRLDAYFSIYLIEYLSITLMFVYLHPRARRLLGAMSLLLFAGFLSIVAVKVAQILWGLPG